MKKTSAKPWRTLSQKTVHKNPWYLIRRDTLIGLNGERRTYFVIDATPCAFIVAMDQDDRVALIRQFRHPIKKDSVEIPGGGINIGEKSLAAAKRELVEETGLKAKRWTRVGKIFVGNGMMNLPCHIYIAREVSSGEDANAFNERQKEGITSVHFVPIQKIIRMIADGDITDDISIAAIMVALAFVGRIS